MGWFKKSDKKKENKQMDDINAGMGEQSEVNEEVDQIFGELDRCYAEVKQSIQKEICGYKDMYVTARNEIIKYKNKVQVRAVMEELLPILSDIINDAQEQTTLDGLKSQLLTRFRQMKMALHGAGVDLSWHEKFQKVDESELLEATVEPTNDPKLHQCVAYTRKMGCVIRGEERYPLREELALYKFEEGERIGNVKSKGTITNAVASQPYYEQKCNDGQLKIGEPRPDLNATLRRERPPRADFTVINRCAIRLNTSISLVSQSKNCLLFKDGTTFYVGNELWLTLPMENINDDYNLYCLYVGTIMVDKEVKLRSPYVYYRLLPGFSDQRASLVLYYKDTTNTPSKMAEINLINE